MGFEQKYPVPLNELLLAPIIFRDDLPELADAPEVTARAMADLASFGGYRDGAIRTAMSRLRAAKSVEAHDDAQGVTRYRLARFGKSIGEAVRGRPQRPAGLVLAIFSFAAEDGRERKTVRDALRLHGFHKLAQNVYVNGQIDTSALELLFEREGLSDHVYWFACNDDRDPRLAAKLTALFDLKARARALAALRDDLLRYLDAPRLDGLTAARRFLYSGPVHYRISFVEEPPLPASYLPADYPLDEVVGLLPRFARTHARALGAWFKAQSR